MTDPVATYQARLDARRTTADRLARQDERLAHLRLLVFGGGLVLGALAWWTSAVGAGWLAIPGLAFLVLVILHARTLARAEVAWQAVQHYERALDRVEGRWAGHGLTGEAYLPEEHPFGRDLDLVGVGSLFERIAQVRTRAGEACLARWLLDPLATGTADLLERQAAVRELAPRLDLAEDLAGAAGGLRVATEPEALAAWGAAPPVFAGPAGRLLPLLAWTLTLATLTAIALLAAGVVGATPLALALAAQWLVGRVLRSRTEAVLAAVARPGRHLLVLAELARRLQTERFTAARLVTLQAELTTGADSAALSIQSLDRLVTWLDSRRNVLFAPIAFAVGWSLHFALAIERWRGRQGGRIGGWFAAVGELEALVSLAAFAFDHPDFPDAEIVEGEPRVEAEGLGHPLLAAGSRVTNDLAVGVRERIWVVSGSNMSGKSTLLRTLGVNVALAQAGAPVCARRLVVTRLALGANIRLQDSLQSGRSRFYAEIQRLKTLVDLAAGPRPLLFLLDELLHGTNSTDRRVGGTALLAGLLRAGAIGLITTHDLAIAEAIAPLGESVGNCHFTDHFEDGRLVFDYQLRPGIVTGSNALALMRSIGLDV
jgi:hypothetical protein